MDDYGKGDDLNELLSRWVMALANAENSRFAQEIDPLTGEPAQVSQWYSSAMLLFLHGVKRPGQFRQRKDDGGESAAKAVRARNACDFAG